MNPRFFLVVLLFFAAVSATPFFIVAETISNAPNYLTVSDQTGAFIEVQDYCQINEDAQKEIARLHAEPDYSIVLDRLESLWSQLDGKLCSVSVGSTKSAGSTGSIDWFIPVRYAFATGRNRTLTDAELNQYRARFDVQADAIAGTNPSTPAVLPTSWRQTIDLFPASTVAPERADFLAELYYQRGDYLAAIALWNRIIADPLFPLSTEFLQTNEPDCPAIRDLFGPKIPRSALLQSSDAEIEARVAWSWIRWLDSNAENRRGINPDSRPDWLESINLSDVWKKIADRFQTRYAQAHGRMAGKSVVLADFLRQTRNGPPRSLKSATVAVPSASESYTVDIQGIWQIFSGKTVLIYKDETPEAIRNQYLPPTDSKPTDSKPTGFKPTGSKPTGSKPTDSLLPNNIFPYIITDGVVIARVGSPIIGQNLNRRTPDGLTNRLVCFDTNQGNTVRWERIPQSPAARWTGAGALIQRHLYVLEFQSGYPAQLYLNCLDAASGELLWRRYLASGSALAAGEKPLIGHFDPRLSGSTALVPLSTKAKAWIDLATGAPIIIAR